MPKYKMILQRKTEHKDVKKPSSPKIEDSTLGEFVVNEVQENGTLKEIFKCFTCENIGPSTDTPKQDKRIVARTYQLEWTNSSKNASMAKTYPKWKNADGTNKAIWVTCDKELPSFRGRRILIHNGNYPQDTEGCILLGRYKNEEAGIVTDSNSLINEFLTLMEKIGAENCELEVKEIQ